MGKVRWGGVLRRVHDLFDEGAVGIVGDRELLDRYSGGGRESAERAFAVLVDRHGPMVLRVCRNVLREEHAAHDAFQATFLVLARKARSLWAEDSIAPWLYQVAVRIASCARNTEACRRRHERKAAERTISELQPREADDRGPILHEEIRRLPERHRDAIVLCYLEGLTHEQAAERLGCPVGTVRSRLAAGRDRLRKRLILRGMAPDTDALQPATPEERTPVVPAALAESVICNVMAQAEATATGVVPAAVSSLAREELKNMMLARSRNWTLGLLIVAGGSSVGVLALAQKPEGTGQPDRPGARAAVAVPLTETIRKCLETRIETAREILDRDFMVLRARATGLGMMGDFDEIPTWSRRLLEDQLSLSATRGQRIAAIREHRDRMILFEGLLGAIAASRIGGQSSYGLEGKYYRVEAHQMLAEEGVDPTKEPPNVEVQKEIESLPRPRSPAPPARR